MLGGVTRYRYSSIASCCCSSIGRRQWYDWRGNSWERYSALGAAILRSLGNAIPQLLGAVVPRLLGDNGTIGKGIVGRDTVLLVLLF